MTDAELDSLLDSLTLDEQISLLAGIDNWHTAAIEHAGIPSMRVSDGPAGVRGTSFTGPASVNVPCGTSLGATWDPVLVETIGQLLGRETRAKGARVLLAPTVNLHRTPVGGRNFECQSEDAYLSARITVGYVKGVQSEGVAACVKHYVGNDTEFERMTIDSQIDQRTLREVYLQPFEAAVREAGAMAIMTAYNRINGPWSADSKELLTDVLRDEWGFDGIVMSDWFGLHSTVEGLEAGLDLEMPGPPRLRGQRLAEAVAAGTVEASLVRSTARRMLRFMDRIGAIADGGPGPEITRDEPEDRELIRAAGAAGMVLLRNKDDALPLAANAFERVAVIGPNALRGRIMGGGSALVNAVHQVHPLEAITRRIASDQTQVLHAPGCSIHRGLPPLTPDSITDGRVSYFANSADLEAGGPVVLTEDLRRFSLIWPEAPNGLDRATFAVRIEATLTPTVSGEWNFGVMSVGRARILVDGIVVADDADSPLGGSFFGMGTKQVVGTVSLESERSYKFVAEYEGRGEGLLRGVIIGGSGPVVVDPFAEAVDLAARSDVSIIVVGTNEDWESEGYDRPNIDLPGRQDELVREVAKVSPRTIVVVNAGSPVAMPWVDEVDAVLFTWFPGQEFGDALVDVLLGEVDPGGRLPVTLPRRFEDSPSFEHHPGRNGAAKYLEGRLIGYRWYDTTGREPLFAFGHGLSYAAAEIVSAQIVSPTSVEVVVANRGDRRGQVVVQVYGCDPEGTGAADDPAQQLVGFAKATLVGSQTSTLTVQLNPRWASHWDVTSKSWAVRPGSRELRIGFSSRDIVTTLTTTV